MSQVLTTSTPGPKPVVGINDLPDEVLLEIFSYLPPNDMARSALACERWCGLLKGEKELWRRKEWKSVSVDATQRFLAFGAGIPRLRSLRLLFDGEYGIRFAWPDVTVHLYMGTPVRWEPYFRSFDTESLVVSALVAEQIASYVECTNVRTLRRICVADQDLGFFRTRDGPYFTFVPTSPHYRYPVPVFRRQGCELAHFADQCYRHDDDPVSGGMSASQRAGDSDPSESEGEAAAAAPEVDTYSCPALEVVNVHCRRFSESRLAELCALGPLRVLRVESRGLRDLWVLRGLGAHLEELTLADCAGIGPWDFSELRKLVGLRALRLGKSHLDEAELRDLTADMPHLHTLSLNGRDLLAGDL